MLAVESINQIARVIKCNCCISVQLDTFSNSPVSDMESDGITSVDGNCAQDKHRIMCHVTTSNVKLIESLGIKQKPMITHSDCQLFSLSLKQQLFFNIDRTVPTTKTI